jgi:hypothetical protein
MDSVDFCALSRRLNRWRCFGSLSPTPPDRGVQDAADPCGQSESAVSLTMSAGPLRGRLWPSPHRESRVTNPRVYVETSVISYLAAFTTSRDLVLAAHQQVTREWWAGRGVFDIYVSQFVLDEASGGDPEAAARRLAAVQEAVLLEVTDDAIALAEQLIAGGGLPARARVDALHVAIATVHGMDYLLSWNCTHIANAALRGRIEAICKAAGFEPPVICTPLELMKE